MDKAITSALLIVVSMLMALMLFNVAYPAVVEGGDAITNMSSRAEERMRSQIEIIHAVGELDSDGWWQDTDGSGRFETFIWVKNIGSSRINGVENMDIFFGEEGAFVRIPHQNQAGGVFPYWSASLENAPHWDPTATLKLTIHLGSPAGSGRYFIRVTTPNGISDDHFLSM